jgi:hypothetical protein
MQVILLGPKNCVFRKDTGNLDIWLDAGVQTLTLSPSNPHLLSLQYRLHTDSDHRRRYGLTAGTQAGLVLNLDSASNHKTLSLSTTWN